MIQTIRGQWLNLNSVCYMVLRPKWRIDKFILVRPGMMRWWFAQLITRNKKHHPSYRAMVIIQYSCVELSKVGICRGDRNFISQANSQKWWFSGPILEFSSKFCFLCRTDFRLLYYGNSLASKKRLLYYMRDIWQRSSIVIELYSGEIENEGSQNKVSFSKRVSITKIVSISGASAA